MATSPIEIAASAIFAIAIIHTFSTGFFARLASRGGTHSGFWHLLAEVEIVFGFWALLLILVMFGLSGKSATLGYLGALDFTEPMFILAIMTVSASRPVMQFVRAMVQSLSERLPVPQAVGFYFLTLGVVPLLGSFITEPAAMTIAALLLRDTVFRAGASPRLKYLTLAVLFVNISIGGVLTPYAAPPVLMVAEKWGFTFQFMLNTFGWRAVLAVAINAALVTVWLSAELRQLGAAIAAEKTSAGVSSVNDRIPLWVLLVHLLFVVLIVVFAHYPVVFLGLMLFFIGFTEAYSRYQTPLIIRESLLVAFFLAGLVVLGALQRWWLQPILLGMSDSTLFFSAMVLTAFTDNAAITYLGSLVDGVSDGFKYALVAGAITGGGLTVIANAPNPAGFALLKHAFENETINPLKLFLAAALPTLVAALAFKLGS